MQSWVESDERGRQYLVRAGTGVVTAIAPIGVLADDDRNEFYRVEIYCDAPHGRPGAIRYSAHPLVAARTSLLAAAQESLDQVWPVYWTVQWHRHDWVPDDLPITALNLSTDTRSLLAGLDPVLLPEPAEVDVADLAPVHWRQDRS